MNTTKEITLYYDIDYKGILSINNKIFLLVHAIVRSDVK